MDNITTKKEKIRSYGLGVQTVNHRISRYRREDRRF